MSEFDKARKKIKHGELLTTVDFFVNSVKPAAYTSGGDLSESAYLKQKALERKAEADEIEKKRKKSNPTGGL